MSVIPFLQPGARWLPKCFPRVPQSSPRAPPELSQNANKDAMTVQDAYGPEGAGRHKAWSTKGFPRHLISKKDAMTVPDAYSPEGAGRHKTQNPPKLPKTFNCQERHDESLGRLPPTRAWRHKAQNPKGCARHLTAKRDTMKVQDVWAQKGRNESPRQEEIAFTIATPLQIKTVTRTSPCRLTCIFAWQQPSKILLVTEYILQVK